MTGTERTERIAARASPREKRIIQAAAEERGLSLSVYLRTTVHRRALRDLGLQPANDLRAPHEPRTSDEEETTDG